MPLRAVAYIDACPAGGGGFTLWPGSHQKIWPQMWSDVRDASRRAAAQTAAERAAAWEAEERAEGVAQLRPDEQAGGYRERAERRVGIGNSIGYRSAVHDEIRAQPSTECAGPAGTVVLVHGVIAHATGPNLSDNIRQAAFYDFHLTPEALPDAVVRGRYEQTDGPGPDIWADWSETLRRTPPMAEPAESGSRL